LLKENSRMPNVKSAAKQARSSLRKKERNHSVQSRIRTGLTRFSELASKKDDSAAAAGRQVVSWLDRAAKTGVIHQNKANRVKARIMRQIADATAKK
jgi:small subunit ribosomal protein S20